MLVIDIKLTLNMVVLAIAGLVLVAVVAYLALGDETVGASGAPVAAAVPQSAPAASENGLRQYYRTLADRPRC